MKHAKGRFCTITLVLALAACNGANQSAVEGKLVDWGGQPVAGVKIVATQVHPLKGYERLESTTESDGTFRIAGLFPLSKYVIEPFSDKWTCATSVKLDSAPKGETALLEAAMQIDHAYSRKDGGRIIDLVAGTTRFTVSEEGVITDSSTALEWLVGPDEDITYLKAQEWVTNCSVGGGGWRMPTRKEIATIYQQGVGTRNIDPVFSTTGRGVWAEPRTTTSVWYFSLSNARSSSHSLMLVAYCPRVFAVRWSEKVRETGFGGPIAPDRASVIGRSLSTDSAKEISPVNDSPVSDTRRFIISSDSVIADSRTSLEWIVGPDRDTSYEEAEKWVTGNSIAGGGWRMPMRKALASLYQKGVGERNMEPIFKTTGWFVWAEPRDSLSSWYFLFSDGCAYWQFRKSSKGGRVLGVRPCSGVGSDLLVPDLRLAGGEYHSTDSNGEENNDRFTISWDGVIGDTLTDLDWVVGPDRDIDYGQAKEWVDNCSRGGGNWRLPTRQELSALYLGGVGSKNLAPVFETSGCLAWAEPRDTGSAWAFVFCDGTEGWPEKDSAKDCRVFGVRSNQRTVERGGAGSPLDNVQEHSSAVKAHSDGNTRFIVSSNGIITDNRTGLEWVVGPDSDTSYEQATHWVAGCAKAGGSWRMPTHDELATLCQEEAGGRRLDPVFKFVDCWVWGDKGNSSKTDGFNFSMWTTRVFAGDNNCRVLAVRSGREPG